MTDPLGMLPLSCWPLEALEELRDSITAAFERRTVRVGCDWLIALDWFEAVTAELHARETFDFAAAVEAAQLERDAAG